VHGASASSTALNSSHGWTFSKTQGCSSYEAALSIELVFTINGQVRTMHASMS
jgi:hypothetical protein